MNVEKAIEAIGAPLRPGIGDGKIFVSNIEEAIRIRTGESGVEPSELLVGCGSRRRPRTELDSGDEAANNTRKGTHS